jgi:hypothetical protein
VKTALLIPLIGTLAWAQAVDVLELRGVVLEVGPNTPLAGAQVTVYQFDASREQSVFSSTVTDTTGAFRFNPARPGDYYVEAAKTEYFGAGETGAGNVQSPSSTGTLVRLTKDHPHEELRFALIRFGEVIGKTVDEDGMPIEGLLIELIPQTIGTLPVLASQSLNAPRGARTAKDGSFRATGVVPGKYVVRISPGNLGMKSPMTDFSQADEEGVDRGFATSWWPGVAERDSAAIATVNPGAVTTLGSSIKVRREPLYRIHFIAQGCQSGEQISLQGPGGLAFYPGERVINDPRLLALEGRANLPCKDVLIPGFSPGSYRFTATTNHSAGAASVSITNRNVTVPLGLVPNGDVLGRVMTADGGPLPVRNRSLQLLKLPGRVFVQPDGDGNFTLTDVKCAPAPLGGVLLPPGYYVKEVRVNGTAVARDALPLCAGSKVEIVVDNKFASLTVSIGDGDASASERIVALEQVQEKLIRPSPPPDQSGAVHYMNLEPGDYRVLAVRNVALPDGEDVRQAIPQLWDRGTTITLAPGDAKNISVKVIDPFE